MELGVITSMRRNVSGFTFLELLCCLLLLSFLLVKGLASNFSLIHRNQLQMLKDEVGMAIRYARNKALLCEKNLVLTPLTQNQDWSKGMILFIDNPHHRYQEGDLIIYKWEWKQFGLFIQWHGFQSNHYIIFSRSLKHAGSNGRFVIMNKQGESKQLVINRIGRVM